MVHHLIQVEPVSEEQPQVQEEEEEQHEREQEQEAAQVEEEAGEETEQVEEQQQEVPEEEEEKYIPRLLDAAGYIGNNFRIIFGGRNFYFCFRQCNSTIKRSKP